MGRHRPSTAPRESSSPGRVTAIVGRRVVVTDNHGERVCFLSGHRAVVGDEVRWRLAKGTGGVLVEVSPRRTALTRMDPGGREQVLAANLTGVVVTLACSEPPFHAPLLDRYLVAARAGGLDILACVTKVDQGVPDDVAAALAVREAVGVRVVATSAHQDVGVDALRSALAGHGAWALVGPSGAGKTSLLAALAPEQDVGPTGEVSSRDGMGRHTTTGSRIFRTGDVELADSPGIRTFTPALHDPIAVRDHFPGVAPVVCRYRDCLHREGEDGCAAPDAVPAALLASYRELMAEVEQIRERRERRR